MTQRPRLLGPGWLLAYALSGVLWILIFELTPIALIVVFAAAGLLGVVTLGNMLQREERR